MDLALRCARQIRGQPLHRSVRVISTVPEIGIKRPPVKGRRRDGRFSTDVKERLQFPPQTAIGVGVILPHGYGYEQELEQLAQKVVTSVELQFWVIFSKTCIALCRQGEVNCCEQCKVKFHRCGH